MGEFELIERYFKRQPRRALLGVGDDCALLQAGAGMQLAISSDMLVEGRHFLAGVDPARLGHKALAVNLSDLAACAARPLAFTLALALPRADEAWLAPFAKGLLALADAHDCELIGGDTTQGPLTICITIFGEVAPGQALLRSGARPGDDVYVSGTVGDARLALEALRGKLSLNAEALARVCLRMDLPTPRVALGLALRGVASAAIDVSDGLLGDLRHVLEASGVGATIATDWVSSSAAVSTDLAGAGGELALDYALAGGDDYELVFTAPGAARAAVQAAALRSATPVTRIGQIDATPGLRLHDAQGQLLQRAFASFDHFAAAPD
jgi:thiamine-monophosphate kinase